MSEIVPDFGCGDGSCVFHVGPRRGVHTNAGCRCVQDGIEDALRDMGVKEAHRIAQVISWGLRRDIQRAVTAAYIQGFDAGMKK